MNPQPDWQKILRDAHNEPLDAAHYTAVRARVRAQLERRPAQWRRLAWLAPLLLLLLLIPVPRPQLPPLRLPVAVIPGAAGNLVARSRPARRAEAPPHPRQPLLIKLQTDNPNIVIYWIAD